MVDTICGYNEAVDGPSDVFK